MKCLFLLFQLHFRFRVFKVQNAFLGAISDNNIAAAGSKHYLQIAKNYKNHIDAIDGEVQRLSDASKAASDKAETLLEQYQGSSLAHWEALSADAEGKVLRFKQGKHVFIVEIQ